MFRTCIDCHHSDFQNLMVKVSLRAYRHAPAWVKRCAYWQEHPTASLDDAKRVNLPGVSFPEEAR